MVVGQTGVVKERSGPLNLNWFRFQRGAGKQKQKNSISAVLLNCTEQSFENGEILTVPHTKASGKSPCRGRNIQPRIARFPASRNHGRR